MIVSFGYKKGIPGKVEKIFDVRDLTHDESSEEFRRKEDEITQYLAAHPNSNIAIGCEKGRHRSRALANHIATKLRTTVYHRDR